MEVFQLVLDGRSNTEIADDLFISYNTVKFHIKNLFKKTGCSSRTELLALFKSWVFISSVPKGHPRGKAHSAWRKKRPSQTVVLP